MAWRNGISSAEKKISENKSAKISKANVGEEAAWRKWLASQWHHQRNGENGEMKAYLAWLFINGFGGINGLKWRIGWPKA